MSFIENLSAESVNMDPVEFDTYTSGKSVPLESWRSNLLMCEGLQKMSQNLKILSELKSQQEQILEGAKQLQEDLDKFKSEINTEVDSVLERTTYTIKIRTKEPIDIGKYTVGRANAYFGKNMLLLKNPQYLPDHYETLTQ